jgi:hypothetical protein
LGEAFHHTILHLANPELSTTPPRGCGDQYEAVYDDLSAILFVTR